MTESADPPAEQDVRDQALYCSESFAECCQAWKCDFVTDPLDAALAELGRLRTTLTETQAELAELERMNIKLALTVQEQYNRALAAEAALATTQAQLHLANVDQFNTEAELNDCRATVAEFEAQVRKHYDRYEQTIRAAEAKLTAITNAASELWDYLENGLGFCDCSDNGSCITTAEQDELDRRHDALGALLGTDTPVSGPVAALPAEPEQPK